MATQREGGEAEEPPAYISQIKMRGFKSFRQADAVFSPGFVCLAGPNGSGKSNICDAIRFAFGEVSLKSLRVNKLDKLIHSESREARVILNLEGREKHEIRRAIRGDGKTLYRFDGRRTTRKAVHEALRPYGVEPRFHNVIAQGQVQRIIEMNGKERREIIDSVSGIAEFEQKKNEALSELDKVQQKINEANITVSERTGFLNELEKEREAALRHQEANQKLKASKATLIHFELEKVNNDHSKYTEQYAKLKHDNDKLQHELDQLAADIKGLEEKKAEITRKLNAQSARHELSAAIDELKVETKTAENIIQERGNEQAQLEERKKKLGKEKSSLAGKLKEAKEALAQLKSESGLLEKQIEKYEKEHKASVESLSGKRVDSLKARLEELRHALGAGRESKLRAEAELAQLSQLIALSEEQLGSLQTGKGKASETGKLRGEEKTLTEEISKLDKELASYFQKEKELNKAIPELERRFLQVKEKVAVLRGSTSPRATSPALLLVKELQEKAVLKGIHGTVAELIEFKPEHSVAIEAAASARLNYVVVEDVDTAEKVIQELKKKKAGRATFIPLTRTVSALPSSLQKLGQQPGSSGFLLDFVRFDPRYYNALHYVFADTLLVDSIQAAKKIGLQKVRMVTYEGDLLEASGIVTGGPLRASVAAHSQLEKLEREVEGLKQERDSLYSQLESVRTGMSSRRKEKAQLEVRKKTIEIELRNFAEGEAEERSRQERLAQLQEKIRQAQKGRKEKESSLPALAEEIEKLQLTLSQTEQELARAESERKAGLSEVEKEISALLAKRADFGAKLSGQEKEIQLFQEQQVSLEENARELAAGEKKCQQEKEKLSEKLKHNQRLLLEKEAEMRNLSGAAERLFTQQKKLEDEISALGQQRGNVLHAYEKELKSLSELEVKQATAGTRLADLKAEFANFSEVPLLPANKEELQKNVRESEEILFRLGNVNLRAPELYEERKAELDELKAKVDRLAAEKEAVLNLIKQIDHKKRAIFLETLQGINAGFQNIYRMIFSGEGNLMLQNPSDPFASALLIKAVENEKERYLDSMSGGEKTLLALVFVFAIQMYKPASFYILDEADAALDKENSKKFVKLIKQLSRRTQFIVVTHNDTVLSSADVALGVMKVKGESKIVGVKLTSAEKAAANSPADSTPATAAPATASAAPAK